MSEQGRKVDAWMPLWIGDYLADTMSLTTEQHGAYLLILMAYWRNRGPLAVEDLPAISRLGVRWPRVKPKLERFFVSRESLWIHGRADYELAEALTRSDNAKAKAIKASNARWSNPPDATSNAPSIPQAMPALCPSPSPSPLRAKAKATGQQADLPEGFAEFWALYPNTAAKKVAVKSWRSLKPSKALVSTIMEKLAEQVSSDDNFLRGFAPHASTYLNGERWNDPIAKPKPNGASHARPKEPTRPQRLSAELADIQRAEERERLRLANGSERDHHAQALALDGGELWGEVVSRHG